MPRPNQRRTIQAERYLARRIAREREKQGWSLEGLAARMTSAGCSIQGSAIYKIENGDPPRRIAVNELAAFSKVFGVPVEDLLLPPGTAASHEISEAVKRLTHAQLEVFTAAKEFHDAWGALSDLLAASDLKESSALLESLDMSADEIRDAVLSESRLTGLDRKERVILDKILDSIMNVIESDTAGLA